MDKICRQCNQSKPLSEYRKHPKSPDGHKYLCLICDSERERMRYQKKKEKIKTQVREWQAKNREKVRRYIHQHAKTPKARLANSLRLTIRRYIHKIKQYLDNPQHPHLFKNTQLGCTLNVFKLYIEPKFKPEMNWSTYGINWEIDHIKPLISWNLENPEERIKANHYTNIQPLSKSDNSKKGRQIL